MFPNKPPPPNADAVCVPNAGVDAAPNAGEDAPKAGVLCPNSEGADAPNVEPPNADCDGVCPNGDGVDPNAGLELACPNAGADAAAPNGFVLDPNVLVPNAGVEAAAPKAGAGTVGLPKAGFVAPKGFVVEVEAKGFGVDACPKVAVLPPNGLDVAGVCPKMPPAAVCEVLAGLGPPVIPIQHSKPSVQESCHHNMKRGIRYTYKHRSNSDTKLPWNCPETSYQSFITKRGPTLTFIACLVILPSQLL